MKAILKICILVFTIQSYAQIIIPAEKFGSTENENKTSSSYYYKDVNGVFNKFLGTWRYQTSTELFEITFRKKEREKTGMGYYEDYIVSRYKYIKNGQTIYNTYNQGIISVAQENDDDYYVFGSGIKSSELNSIQLLYDEPDLEIDFDGRLVLTYNPVTQKLEWKVTSLSKPDPNNPNKRITPFKVPTRMTLTKVN
ncbi:DUF6705 family protein [Aquimarina sp. 2201CG14-23]|uniref:DUF6705 family protein n=1 Tax=Aquimarina mycalae TaxID=3040073 RepID=UPI00247805AC|nr:DUF6705 family protein [Aquimarina sp. 2201CG14-23]MDH7446343.1 hypothetical protein [Aquimarina sp. 2201CG14-23]